MVSFVGLSDEYDGRSNILLQSHNDDHWTIFSKVTSAGLTERLRPHSV